MPLITNVAYSPDPTDGQALGLDVAVDGATRLVINWGDGSPLQTYTVEPGSTSIHLSHDYAGPAAGTIAIRAAAPGVPDDRTTLNLFVGADEAYSRVSGDPEEPEITRKDPVISADGQWVAWADAYNQIYSGYGVTLKNLVDGTTVTLGSTHGDAYEFDGGPVMLANGNAIWFAERYSGIEGYEFHPVVLYRTEAGDWTTLRDAYDVTVTDDAKYAVYRRGIDSRLGQWLVPARPRHRHQHLSRVEQPRI